MLTAGSEEDPGTEQAAGAASWGGTDDGFAGAVLEGDMQLEKSEAESWAGCAAVQVVSARSLRSQPCWSCLCRTASPLPAACPAWLPEVATFCGGVSPGPQMGF